MPTVEYSTSATGMRPTGLPRQFRVVARALQLAAGTAIIAIGLVMGWRHAALIYSGAQARGRIVDMKTRLIRSSSSTTLWKTAHIPIVEYRIADRVIRFEDWLSRREEQVGDAVPVRYDPVAPSTAMIDRPVWNWLPWAPIVAVGLLVFGSGALGLVRLRWWPPADQ